MPIDIVKVKSIDQLTHDVIRIFTEKPKHYTFVPGQATEISINKSGWKNKKRPFTFTSLPDRNYLEFTIKIYPSQLGVTNQLLELKKDNELILHDVFGAISYRDEGIFIAGGAGITPFISIFRGLDATKQLGNNKLIFANKTKADIILESEFTQLLGNNFINILSEEKLVGYENGFITEALIESIGGKLARQFYVCGPPAMMDTVLKQLVNLGVNEKQIIKEKI